VDLYAPGESIYSLEPGGGAGTRNGTSFSAAFNRGRGRPAAHGAAYNDHRRNRDRAPIRRRFHGPPLPVGRLNLEKTLGLFVTPSGAPVIDSFTLSESNISPGQTISISVAAHDPDGDPLTYTWDARRRRPFRHFGHQ